MKNPGDRVTLETSVPQTEPIIYVPKRIVGDIVLTAVAHQVLYAIAQSPVQDSWHLITLKEMHEKTSRSKNAIRAALLQLEERGYILISPARQPGKLRQTHQYLVMYDEVMHDGC